MLACVAVLGGCQPAGETTATAPVSRAAAPSAERGRLVFWSAGCASCHATPGAGLAAVPPLGGGLALETAFGTFRAPNISPDAATGIGGWSAADFARALREGRSPEGRNYYPVFPYPSYSRMSEGDIADLWAWLQRQPKVANAVAASTPGVLLRDRNLLAFWNALYLRPGKVVPLAAASPEVARGQYLVEGPGHCGECHTPRNALGGPRRSRWLAGGNVAEDGVAAPNLTPDATGLGGWSAAEIVEALKQAGREAAPAFGMAAVRQNLSHLPESDLAAIAAYLKAIPPVASLPGG